MIGKLNQGARTTLGELERKISHVFPVPKGKVYKETLNSDETECRNNFVLCIFTHFIVFLQYIHLQTLRKGGQDFLTAAKSHRALSAGTIYTSQNHPGSSFLQDLWYPPTPRSPLSSKIFSALFHFLQSTFLSPVILLTSYLMPHCMP